MEQTDVVIVGAGPAGCAAAITLSRHGLSSIVIDKAVFPRDKICGDGLTTSALRELEFLGLQPQHVQSWINVDTVVVRSPSGREVEFPLPQNQGTFAAVAKRADLDNELVALTQHQPLVTLRQNVAISEIVNSSTGAIVTTSDGTQISARFVIAADGMWSPTRKLLQLPPEDYRGEWHAFRQYFDDVSPRAARELMVWFEPDLLPGYAWSFPLANGGANVGFGILRDSSTYHVGDMSEVWKDLLRRPHIANFLGPMAHATEQRKAWPIPAQVSDMPLHQQSVLFVGDAAAATDPMTGEGIGQALLTGRWAAEAIAAGGDIGKRYSHQVKNHLGRDHAFAEQLAKLLSRPRTTRAALRVAGISAWTRKNFARWLFEDYPRALLLTPRRWHRKMLSGAGAYGSEHAHTSN